MGLEDKELLHKEKFEKKLETEEANLEIAKDNLKFALFNTIKEQKRQIKELADEDTFMDDEFFDRTLEKKVKTEEKESGKVENFHTLQEKLKELYNQKHELEIRFLESQGKSTQLTAKLDEEKDIFDDFMQANEEKRKQENKQIYTLQLEKLNQQIEETKSMLTMIKPDIQDKLSQILDTNFKNFKAQEKDQKDILKKREIKEKEKNEKIEKEIFDIPELPKKGMRATLDKLHELAEKDKEGEVDEEEMKLYASYIRAEEEEEQRKIKRKQKEEKKEELRKQIEQKKVYSVKQKPASRNLREKDIEIKEDEEIIDEWIPPETQSGDGYTKLNKFFNY